MTPSYNLMRALLRIEELARRDVKHHPKKYPGTLKCMMCQAIDNIDKTRREEAGA